MESVEILKREWEKGTPAAQIGNMINKTKNAVIGKAHRLKLSGRVNPIAPDKNNIKVKVKKFVEARAKNKASIQVENREKSIKKVNKRAPVFYPEPIQLGVNAPISIMELKTNNCRAPVGRGADGLVTYCGNEVFKGKVFCPGHCVLYYRPAESRRRA